MRSFNQAEGFLQAAYDSTLGEEVLVDLEQVVRTIDPMYLHIVFDSMLIALKSSIRDNPQGQLAQVMRSVANARATELHGDHDLAFFERRYGLRDEL